MREKVCVGCCDNDDNDDDVFSDATFSVDDIAVDGTHLNE